MATVGRIDAPLYSLIDDAANDSIPPQLDDIIQAIHRASYNDLASQDQGGRNALHWAAGEGFMVLCEKLLERAPNLLESRTKTGHTPLARAAVYGHVDVVQFLLDHNANVNVKSNLKETPLIRAARWGHLDVVELLLRHNADTTCRDHMGKSATDWARQKHFDDILQCIESSVKISQPTMSVAAASTVESTVSATHVTSNTQTSTSSQRESVPRQTGSTQSDNVAPIAVQCDTSQESNTTTHTKASSTAPASAKAERSNVPSGSTLPAANDNEQTPSQIVSPSATHAPVATASSANHTESQTTKQSQTNGVMSSATQGQISQTSVSNTNKQRQIESQHSSASQKNEVSHVSSASKPTNDSPLVPPPSSKQSTASSSSSPVPRNGQSKNANSSAPPPPPLTKQLPSTTSSPLPPPSTKQSENTDSSPPLPPPSTTQPQNTNSSAPLPPPSANQLEIASDSLAPPPPPTMKHQQNNVKVSPPRPPAPSTSQPPAPPSRPSIVPPPPPSQSMPEISSSIAIQENATNKSLPETHESVPENATNKSLLEKSESVPENTTDKSLPEKSESVQENAASKSLPEKSESVHTTSSTSNALDQEKDIVPTIEPTSSPSACTFEKETNEYRSSSEKHQKIVSSVQTSATQESPETHTPITSIHITDSETESDVNESFDVSKPRARSICASGAKQSGFPIRVEGWLAKLGHIFKNWKHRYFVLEGRTVWYFAKAGQPHSKKKGVIRLDENSSVYIAETYSKPFCFSIKAQGKIYEVQAADDEEVDEWVAAIKNNMEALDPEYSQPEYDDFGE